MYFLAIKGHKVGWRVLPTRYPTEVEARSALTTLIVSQSETKAIMKWVSPGNTILIEVVGDHTDHETRSMKKRKTKLDPP